jgi:hypothetical protein
MTSAKAREMVTTLGYSDPVADRVGDFSYDEDFMDYAEKNDKPRPAWDPVLAERPSLLDYWYRQSPRDMIPDGLSGYLVPGVVTFNDPPPTLSGMINLRLDPEGRLIYFQAMPPEVQEHPQPSQPVDWNKLFAAAGLDSAQLQPAEPTWTSLASADARAAWTGTWPGSNRALRVEAAAWRGRPVFFSLIGPWTIRGCYETHSVVGSVGEQTQKSSPGGAIQLSPALRRWGKWQERAKSRRDGRVS